jgi:hypothetical protein
MIMEAGGEIICKQLLHLIELDLTFGYNVKNFNPYNDEI